QHAGEMALKFLAAMDAAARIDGALHQRSRLRDFRNADVFADQGGARLLGKDRPVTGVAKADARFGAFSFTSDAQGARNTDDGEIAAPSRHLDKARTRSRRRDRKLNLRQHLVRLERRGERANEKIPRLDPSLAPHR